MPDAPLEELLEKIAGLQDQTINRIDRLNERLDFVDLQIQQIREEFRWNGPVSFAATVFDKLDRISADVNHIGNEASGTEMARTSQDVAKEISKTPPDVEDALSSQKE